MTGTRPDEEPRSRGPIGSYALKENCTFLVADALGNVNGGADGLFRDDTRVLSRFRLTIGEALPALLSSGLSDDNVFFRANLTNRPLPPLGGHATPEGVIHIERSRLLYEDRLYERLKLTNYGEGEVATALTLEFGADFADIFEVRGRRRVARGRLLAPDVGRSSVCIRYEGLDGVVRASVLAFSQLPHTVGPEHATFKFGMRRHGQETLYLEIGTDPALMPGELRYRLATARARVAMRRKRRRGSRLRTSGGLFNLWIDKSRADLALLEADLPTGPYPFAGIPWFCTPFGRDAIITSLQTLWLDPARARGVLAFLAKTQAHEASTFADSAPGKILHETRRGEMAALGEVPFARYYGGVDTTPLFIMLAGAYARRTADLAFVDTLWPSLVAALAWIDARAAANPMGFVDYERGEASGLTNQGWKDSVDSVFHADGRLPKGPIALLEVQGYVFAARQAMAELAARRGDEALQNRCREGAEAIRAAVEASFWMPERAFYAIAIDGEGELCRVSASNAGHLVYTGLPSGERARHVATQLFSPAFDCGWGVRTVSERSARYNPMSYHNGSVWPHDSALCAAGVARYGERAGVRHLLDESFACARHFEMRLPELLCGFARRPGEGPVGYPVACLPQSWSSGAIFMLLQAGLGLDVDAFRREIVIDSPELPTEIDRLEISGMAVGDDKVDLQFQRTGDRVLPSLLRTVPGSIRLVVRG